MSGVTAHQVASAAQGVFVDEGFDLAAVSSSTGFVRTVWREGPRRQLMFTVSTDQVTDEEGNDLRGVKQVTVQGFARDRLVGGWSEEYQTDYRIDEVLDAVADRLTDPSFKPTRARAATKVKAECKATADCPDGKHCAGKKCVAECQNASDCEEGQGCDYRGRCVTPPLEPEPCPVAPAPAPAAGEDTDTAEDAEGEEAKSEEVAP